MKLNNSSVGFTIQKSICDCFNIIPESDRASRLFATNELCGLNDFFKKIVQDVFSEINLVPVKCTTFLKNQNGTQIPFNFILSNGQSLSIRTSISGGKIAPRIVGQAGLNVLNNVFGQTYGKRISSQSDVKQLIYYHIDKVFPIMFDYFMDADYIIWLYLSNGVFKYKLIKKTDSKLPTLEKKDYSFSREYNDWKNSLIIKVGNKSLAEAQAFKDRLIIFRFYAKNLIDFILNN